MTSRRLHDAMGAYPEIQQLFDRALQPLWDRQEQLENEIRTLAEARDVLLPRLLSGKLPIGGAEHMLEAQA